jgi:hypothetical protein
MSWQLVTDRTGWHRIKDEHQLEDLIRGGWTDFTLRPYGPTIWIYINEELFDKREACLALPGFQQKGSPSWHMFRELLTDVRFNRACVPGPLTAHEIAQLEIGKAKREGILTIKSRNTCVGP